MVGPSGFELPQPVLDRLAAAWSELDRSRPRLRREVRQAGLVVVRWAESALAVDTALIDELQGSYVAMRAEEEGGPQVEGLRWAQSAVEEGHDLSSMLRASAGAEREFWELYWRPVEELRAAEVDQDGRRQYADFLAAQPVRVPASMSTSFLLRMALHLRI